jgi:hypothetical protein
MTGAQTAAYDASLGGGLKGLLGDAVDWAKKNPGLARLIAGGVGGLVGGIGAHGNSGAPAPSGLLGPATPWKSSPGNSMVYTPPKLTGMGHNLNFGGRW